MSSSSVPIGGSSRIGRIVGPTLDKIIKNAAWRKHTHLVSSCKSSLDLLQTLTDENCHDNLETLLNSLILALDSAFTKLIDPALDCLLRLLSLRLLYGDVDPAAPRPILSKLLDSICGLANVGDDAIELAVLKIFITAVRSEVLFLKGEVLVQIVKSCYNVYLGSGVGLNQVAAKLALAQIVRIVYARVEVNSMEVKVKTVSVADLLDLSDKSLNDAGLVQAAQGFIDEAMEGINTQFLRSLKYKKLERTPSGISARRRITRLGSGRRKRSWKIPKLFRVRFRIPSPKKLLLRLRDVYVNSMLMIAGGTPSAKKEVKVRVGDFEMRLMQHVYNTLLSTSGELNSCV